VVAERGSAVSRRRARQCGAFSIGAAFRARGSRVLYFAGYKLVQDRYKVEEIEHAADRVVWCCDEAPGFAPDRPQDRAFIGNIVEAIKAYGRGALGPVMISLSAVDRIIAIGSDGMMAAVAEARQAGLKTLFPPGSPRDRVDQLADAVHDEGDLRAMPAAPPGSLDGHRDGRLLLFNQDQEMDRVDFRTLRRRLSQNGVQEKLTKLWVDRCLQHLGKRPALAAEGIKLKRRIFFFRREELSGSSEFGLRAVDSRHVASKAKTSRIVLASKSRITLSHRRICRDAR